MMIAFDKINYFFTIKHLMDLNLKLFQMCKFTVKKRHSYSSVSLTMLSVISGKLVRRQRLPKNDVGDFWLWKDLNVAINLPCYGRVFRIYDCDRWTRVCTVYTRHWS